MLIRKLRATLAKERAHDLPQDFGGARPAPGRPLYAIGDIHGRADLVEPLLEKIDADLDAHGAADPVLVFLGDYVDRGDASAEVLTHVRDLSRSMPDNVVCLMGNHERMLLDFIDDPAHAGPFWLRHGGLQTLASFGIGDIPADAEAEHLVAISARLRDSMAAGLETWLRDLPLIWTRGNVSCVHAAMDPHRPPDRQSPRVLQWGHPEFLTLPRDDRHWVIHGHTIVEAPRAEQGRISVDTGAWYTGRLSAAAVTGDGVRFL